MLCCNASAGVCVLGVWSDPTAGARRRSMGHYTRTWPHAGGRRVEQLLAELGSGRNVNLRATSGVG